MITIRYAASEYFLIALEGEDDIVAEQAFNSFKHTLSDKQLLLLLSQGQKDSNVQFYIALMAAQRGLHCKGAYLRGHPGFMMTNSYTNFGNSLTYPIAYEEFLARYNQFADNSVIDEPTRLRDNLMR
jgi:hypothetical protein